MDKQKVSTLIKRDHAFGGNEFTIGKISGIGYCISEYDTNFINIDMTDEGYLYTSEFTPDEYDKFINVIEELYPGLCEFNCQIKESE